MADNTNTSEKQNTALASAQSPVFKGRDVIFCDPVELTDANVLAILEKAMIKHESNRIEMQYLREYEKGDMPIFYRVKNIREDVNVKCGSNYAKLITDFKIGYEFSAPFMFVQRAKDDFLKADPSQDDKRVATLNEMLFEQGKPGKDIQLAHDFKTCGLGYMMAYPKLEESDDIAPFDLIVLNPLNTACVYTNDAYRRKMMAFTYSIKENQVSKRFTVYTKDFVYTIEGGAIIAKMPNMIGKIPIVEFVNDQNRQACFEAVLPLADCLNLCNSDRLNDIGQFVQAILWLNNCKLDENQQKELREGGYIQTTSTADGRDAKVTYVTTTLNQSETQSLVDYLYGQMLEIAGVPGRDTASGGNTGSAILLSNGWQLAETMAKTMEHTFSSSEMELLDVINDPTPDRPNIVKTRIRILENREKRYNNVKRKIAAKQKQPLPDKDGFKHFLFIIAATFAYILIEILFSRDGFSLITKFNLGRFFGTVKYFPTIGIFGWYTYYIPFFRRNVWDEKKQLTFPNFGSGTLKSP